MNCIEDLYVYYDEVVYEYLQDIIKCKSYTLVLPLIEPTEYEKAALEFVKYGYILRFPAKKILNWKSIILHNFIKLEAFSDLAGHSQNFPIDEVSDAFEMEFESSGAGFEFLSEYDDEMFPTWSNGHYFISDYGIKPLGEIAKELLDTNDINKIIPLVSKALDVSHQRSDLSELFIKGGTESLNKLSL